MYRIAAILVLTTLCAAPAVAQRMSYGKAPMPGDTGPAAPEGVDYEQRLGQKIPLDLELYDHTGSGKSLRELVGGKPTILVLAYYRCPRLCNEVLSGLLDTLNGLRRSDPTFVAGGPFNVITCSIDPKEGPITLARPRRQAFLMEYDGRSEDVPGVWFLSASHGQGTDVADADRKVHELADAVGYRYTLRQRGKDYRYDSATGGWATPAGELLRERAKDYDYQHPPGIVFIAPDGTITRYLLGVDYTPTTVRMAIVEASGGTVGSLADKIAFSCSAYDAVSGHYRTTMRVVGWVFLPVMLLVVGMAAYTARRALREKPLTPPAAGGPVAPPAVSV